MKKLLVICPYPQGLAPSQRLKYEQYFEAFREDGWEITVKPFINTEFWKIIYKKGNFFRKAWFTLVAYIKRLSLLGQIKNYELVYLHLWATPFGAPFFERLIRRRSRRLIYDIDDLIYLKGQNSQANPITNWIKGKNKALYLIRNADHVITCTPYLDEFARRYNQNTTDISSTVDTLHRYQPVNCYQNDHIPVIGWSGSYSTSKYYYLLENVFKRLSQNRRFKLLVMGDSAVAIPGLEIEAVDWTDEHEIELLQRFDIGVYPLPDEEWVYGKSGLKAIQYMALGIPTVATAIGANHRIIENGISGFLVNTEDEWLQALTRLIDDPELRQRIGTGGRRKVENEFSIEANKKKYLKILNSE